MATISISFDTEDKDIEVSIDGKKLDDVTGVQIYRPYVYSTYEANDKDADDVYCCEITTLSQDEESGIKTLTRVVASESKTGKELEAEPMEDCPAFKAVAKVVDDLGTDVAEYVGSYFSDK